MIVLLDQDGVLADFEGALFAELLARYPQVAAIAPDQRRQFRAVDDYPVEVRDTVVGAYSARGFFLGLEPVPGAIAAVKEMLAVGIDVRICTAPVGAYEHCVVEKYQWLERHFGRDFTTRVIMTKDKTLVRGDWLVDDNPNVSGAVVPVWRHAIFDAPYNQQTNGTRLTWESWRSVLAKAY